MEDPAISVDQGVYGEHPIHPDSTSIDNNPNMQRPEQHRRPSKGQSSEITLGKNDAQNDNEQPVPYDPNKHGLRKIIQNFTPS